VDAQASSENN
jgi:arsenite/tail-anchored protein-transporting ATPase